MTKTTYNINMVTMVEPGGPWPHLIFKNFLYIYLFFLKIYVVYYLDPLFTNTNKYIEQWSESV